MKQLLTIYFTFFTGLMLLAQPANDLCTNAEPINDLDGTCNAYSNVGATSNNPYVPPCFNYTNITWFSFVADGSNADITVSGVNRPEVAIIGLDQAGGTDLCDINDVASYGCATDGGNYSTITLSLNNNSLIPGETYLIAVVNNTGGGGGAGTFDLCVDNPENTSPSTCADAQPFCTADGDVTYDAGVDDGTAEPGNDYDCLTTQPNPAWFFLEIDDPGDLDLSFTSNPAEDIDYAAWGPFADQATACDNLTAGNVVGCSFAAATSESLSLTGTQTGEVYAVMITNYSNNPTEITFSQTGGGATTNCGIVLPVELNDFQAEKLNNDVEITWQTASELNNDYFVLEHSINGSAWKQINKIDGAGSTSERQTYSTLHRSAPKRINYYRLKQVDFDGTITNHGIVSVDNGVDKKLVKRLNTMGQEVDENFKGIVIEYYSDGTTRKVMQ